MKAISQNTLTDTIRERFLKEKKILKDMVYKEIALLEKNKVYDKCSVDFFKDAIFVIDRGFDNIMKNINEHNIKERERQLEHFKDSLLYAMYGK